MLFHVKNVLWYHFHTVLWCNQKWDLDFSGTFFTPKERHHGYAEFSCGSNRGLEKIAEAFFIEIQRKTDRHLKFREMRNRPNRVSVKK